MKPANLHLLSKSFPHSERRPRQVAEEEAAKKGLGTHLFQNGVKDIQVWVQVDASRSLRLVALPLLLEHVELDAQVRMTGSFMPGDKQTVHIKRC